MTDAGERRLADALQNLVDQLGSVIAAYDAPATDDRDNENYRMQAAALFQLKHVLGFLETIGAQPRLVAPLLQVCMALNDVNAGIANPLLVPSKKPTEQKARTGSRVLTSEILVWSWAVAAVEALLDASPTRRGSDLEAALDRVAPLIGPALGRRDIGKIQLKSRRKDLGGRRAPAEMQAEYDRHLAALRTEGKAKGLSKRQVADIAVASLRAKALPQKVG